MTNQRIDQNIQLRLYLCEAVSYLRECLLSFVSEILKHNRVLPARINRDREQAGLPKLCIKGGRIRWESRTLLWAIDFYWESAFHGKWRRDNRAMAILIKSAINEFYHENPLTPDSTTDTLRNMRRLLRQVPPQFDASKQVERIEDILKKINSGSFSSSQAGKTLPITFIPHPPESAFKTALMDKKRAYITIYYNDGHQNVEEWKIVNFNRSSSVSSNLRSRPKFRRGEWQKAGIVKVEVSIEKPQGA